MNVGARSFFSSTITELGHPPGVAESRATVAYAIYIGLLQLAREVPERLADEEALGAELLGIIAGGGSPSQ